MLDDLDARDQMDEQGGPQVGEVRCITRLRNAEHARAAVTAGPAACVTSAADAANTSCTPGHVPTFAGVAQADPGTSELWKRLQAALEELQVANDKIAAESAAKARAVAESHARTKEAEAAVRARGERWGATRRCSSTCGACYCSVIRRG